MSDEEIKELAERYQRGEKLTPDEAIVLRNHIYGQMFGGVVEPDVIVEKP